MNLQRTKKNLSYVFISLPGVVLLLLFFYARLNFVPVESRFALNSFIGDPALVSNPVSGKYYAVSIAGEAELDLPFSEDVSIGGLSLFFPGNLHEVSSYLSHDFSVYIQTVDGWKKVKEIKNNNESSVRVLFPQNFTTSAVKIVFEDAAFSDTVLIQDIHFFKLKKATFFEKVFFARDLFEKSFFAYVFYTLGFFFMVLVPGFVLLDLVLQKKRVKFSNENKLIFGPVISLLLLSFSTLLFILFGHPIFLYFYLFVALYCLFLFIKSGQWYVLKKNKFSILLCLVVLLVVNLLQAKRDYLFNLNYIEKYIDSQHFVPEGLYGGYYGYHADNTMQWGVSRMYLNRAPLFSDEATKYRIGFGPELILDRTPLFPMLFVPILKVFGESHFIYQRFLNVLMCFYYAGAFSLVKKYFSERAAVISSLFLLLSVQLTYQVFNAEIYFKYVAIYPILLALVLFIESKNPHYEVEFIMGILLALSFLIHPIALFFVITLALVYVKKYGVRKELISRSFRTFLPVSAVFLLWEFFTRYLRSIAPGEQLRRGIYETQITTYDGSLLVNKLKNVVNIFLPELFNLPQEISFFSVDYLGLYYSRFSLIAAFTPLLFLSLVYFLTRCSIIKKYWMPLWFGTIPFVVFLVFFHAYSHGAFMLLYPFVLPFLFGFLAQNLLNVSFMKRVYLLLSYPLLMLPSLYYLSEVFTHLNYESDIVSAIFFVLILSFGFFSFRLVKAARE